MESVESAERLCGRASELLRPGFIMKEHKDMACLVSLLPRKHLNRLFSADSYTHFFEVISRDLIGRTSQPQGCEQG